jgi:hypothetical protein
MAAQRMGAKLLRSRLITTSEEKHAVNPADVLIWGEPKPHCQCGSAWQARSCLAGVQPEDSRALEQAQVSQQQQMLKQKQRDEKTDAAKISRLVK